MSYDGSGTYALVAGLEANLANGQPNDGTEVYAAFADIATALTTAICKDGQTTITANLPMAGFRHTGVGNPTARTQYGSVAGIQDGTYNYLTSVAGTNTVTATGALSLAAYAAGQCFWFIPANTNSGATTININSIGAKNIYNAGAACVGEELKAGVPAAIIYDGTRFHLLATTPTTGNVLQCVTAEDAGSTTTSTSLTNVSAANVGITPKSGASDLVIEVTFHGTEAVRTGANSVATFQLYDVTQGFVIGEEYTLTAAAENGGAAAAAPCVLRAIMPNTVSTLREFQLQAKTNHNSAAAGAVGQVWSITEVKS